MNFKIKKAFTLVELMVVMGIIAILLVAAMYLLDTQNTKQQRAIRFAELTEDIITSAKQDMIIGRGTWSGSPPNRTMIPNQSRSVVIGSESIKSQYTPVGETSPKVQREYKKPFLDGDKKYTIESIKTSEGRIRDDKVTKGWTPIALATDTITLAFGSNGTMTLSNNDVSFMITIEYEGFRRYVVGDTVSGIITTYRQEIKKSTP